MIEGLLFFTKKITGLLKSMSAALSDNSFFAGDLS